MTEFNARKKLLGDGIEPPDERVVDPQDTLEDEVYGASLRPRTFADYVGQTNVVENLRISIDAAKRRAEPIEHVLFYGPPGLGKTTLAALIARELGANFRPTSGPTLEKPKDLVGILTSLEDGDVLFIDEIHRLGRVVEEFLYPAMEDFQIDFVVDRGAYAKTIKLPLKRFTLVGATTRAGMLTAPLRERFGIVHHLDYYSVEELERIVTRSAGVLSVPIDRDGALTIARRSRGTPRIANRLLRRVRDYAEVRAEGVITAGVADEALQREGVDELGLDRLDRAFLRTIVEHYGGGPVGIGAIAATLTEDAETLEDVVEPYLLKHGFVMRTASGRKATPHAYYHLGKDPESRHAGAIAVVLRRSAFLAVLAAAGLSKYAPAQEEYDPATSASAESLRVLLGQGEAVSTPGGGFLFDGRPYRGSFSKTSGGSVVNMVTLEEYLYSVVPREMPPSWPDAALQAQAICARTYVLQRSNPRQDYDLVPSELNQVYGGVASESPSARAAVDATAGNVLRFGNGFAQAVYSSCCGGHTEASSDAWGGAPFAYLSGVVCSYCTASPEYRWQREIDLTTIASAFASDLEPYGTLQNVRVSEIDASGRARTIELAGEHGSAFVKGSVFRLHVGARTIPSLLITKIESPEQAQSTIALEGGGLGHGVGLCQWGARGYALAGGSSRDILSLYFRGTEVVHD